MFEAHFQTFEDPESGVALSARLSAFREELARRKLSGFVVPRADQQQNEYVAPSEERLAWLTGFTGSAGSVLVSAQTVLITDFRYKIQAGREAAGAASLHILKKDFPRALAETARALNAKTVWFDETAITIDALRKFRKQGLKLRGCRDLVAEHRMNKDARELSAIRKAVRHQKINDIRAVHMQNIVGFSF